MEFIHRNYETPMSQNIKKSKPASIKEWPESERPREILLDKGPEYVSDAGLIAILLRTGTHGSDAVSIGRELLAKFGGLKGLFNANRKELEEIRGLGQAKIAQLLSAIEIGKRQLKEGVLGKQALNSPESVIEYLSMSICDVKDELFKVIYLNSAHEVISVEDLFRGTVNQSAIYPREVIKKAFELNASALIFVHNHPSGSLEPSDHDLSLTGKLVQACKAVDLTPLDHIIISHSGHTSFKDRGLM